MKAILHRLLGLKILGWAYSNELSENNESSTERHTRGYLSGNSVSIHKTGRQKCLCHVE